MRQTKYLSCEGKPITIKEMKLAGVDITDECVRKCTGIIINPRWKRWIFVVDC